MNSIYITFFSILYFIFFINGNEDKENNILPYDLTLPSNIRFPQDIFTDKEYFINIFDEILDILNKLDDKKKNQSNDIYDSKINTNSTLNLPINRNLNPCDDFYTYVCGEWSNMKNELQNSNEYFDRYTDSYNIVTTKYKYMVESFNNYENVIEKSIYNYYKKCKDYYKNYRYNTSYVLSKLKRNDHEKLSSLEDLMISQYHESIFYRISTEYYYNDSTINQISISINTPDIHFDFYYEKNDLKYTKKYKKYLKNILELLIKRDKNFINSNDKKSEIKKRINVLLSYIEFLLYLKSDFSNNQDIQDCYESMTVEELSKLTPSINWTNYFLNIIPYKLLYNQDISKFNVYIYRKDMFSKMEDFLSNLRDESYKYLIEWILIFNNYDKLDNKFQYLKNKYFQYTKMNYTDQKIIDMCYFKVFDTFKDYTDYSYLNLYFHDNEKKDVEMIIKNILNTFNETINNSDWITSKTKSIINEKIYNMKIIVGYDSKFYNYTKIYDDFLEMEPFTDSDTFIDMDEKVSKWKYELQFKNLLTLNTTKINIQPIYGDIFYMSKKNILTIPIYYLLNDFYSINNSVPLNLGGIGFLTILEIFDKLNDCSKNYIDSDDNYKYCDKKTNENYLNKSECIDEAYNKTSNNNEIINFRYLLLKNELINKDGGLRVAFETMKKLLNVDDFKDKIKYNGLEDFNDDQQFFINYAFNYCEHNTICINNNKTNCNDNLWRKINVNNPLKNNEDFRRAFNCKATDPMVNEQICRIF